MLTGFLWIRFGWSGLVNDFGVESSSGDWFSLLSFNPLVLLQLEYHLVVGFNFVYLTLSFVIQNLYSFCHEYEKLSDI